MIMYHTLKPATDFKKDKRRVRNEQQAVKGAIDGIWSQLMYLDPQANPPVSNLSILANKSTGFSMFQDDGYGKASRAAKALEKDLLAAKQRFDDAFKAWLEQMDEVGREVFPETMPEALFEEFKATCEIAREAYMPVIEASYSRLENIYQVWTWLKSCIWDEVDVYQTTNEISDTFRHNYNRINPIKENEKINEKTPLYTGMNTKNE